MRFINIFSSFRYESEQDCEGTEECGAGTWFASDWGACSVSCGEGGGQKFRKVFCISGEAGEPVAPDQCQEDLKPFEEDKCNDEPCEKEQEEGSGGSGDGSGSGDDGSGDEDGSAEGGDKEEEGAEAKEGEG